MKAASENVFRHPLVLGALAITAVIAAGSFIYYIASTRLPAATTVSTAASSTAQSVTAAGSVEPAQNPDLAFLSGGRVARVNVSVGQSVSQGQVLASLDVSTLAAQRANAAANLATQQANLAEMQAGPRQVDVEAKQTAVDQANTTLKNTYANVAANITQSYDQSLSDISVDTDTLFNQPDTANPTLAFGTTNNQASVNAINTRVQANNTLSTWGTSLGSVTDASSPQDLDAALALAIQNLNVLHDYTDQLVAALANAIPTASFPQSSITAAQTSVSAYRSTINGLILTLQGIQQQIASNELAVQSAQDALSQVMAGSTQEQLAAQQAQVDAAQANVSLYDAQIGNATIVAPFSGTVASVQVKQGDIVAPNTAAISLNPESALQVTVYLSEIDVTKIKVGTPAEVTLDAYGSSRIFNADVVSIDTSPSPVSGAAGTAGTVGGDTGYKVTLQFLAANPAVSSGMTANVSIPIAQ